MAEATLLPEEIAHRAKVKEREHRLIAYVAGEIKKTFGPPPIVIGEDPKDFDRLLFGIIRIRCPGDHLEKLFVWDLATATWADRRLDLVTRQTLDRKIRQNLKFQKSRREEQAKQHKTKQDTEEYLADIKGDHGLTAVQKRESELETVIEDTPTDVDTLLDRAEAEAAHAEAFRQTMPLLTTLDDMKSRNVFRRNISLEMWRRYRPRLLAPMSLIEIQETDKMNRENRSAWFAEMYAEEKASGLARTQDPAEPSPPPTVPAGEDTPTVPADEPVKQ